MSKKTEKIFQRAQENFEKENHEHALRLFNQVLNREPTHAKALRNKALIKVMVDGFEEAEDFLLFAIDQQPKDDVLYQLLGTVYHNHGEPQKALAQFKKAIKLNEQNVLAQLGIATLYANVFGEHEHAITHYSKAIEQENDNADLYFKRGCSFMILQEMSKAEEDLKKATSLDHGKAEELLEKYFN